MSISINQIKPLKLKVDSLYGLVGASSDVTMKDVVEKASCLRREENPELDDLSYKGVVNRLSAIRRGKYASISSETIELLELAASQLIDPKLIQQNQ